MYFPIKSLLICVLTLVGTTLASDWCSNYHGRQIKRWCTNAYCCGDRAYQYCCTDCTKRYPITDCSSSIIRSSFSSTMSTMRITWIVIGVILALKGIAALIYFCCCRKNRRNQPPRPQPIQIGVPMPGQAYPTQPGQTVDSPPSYDDLVKDGVLNAAYEHQCEGADNNAPLPGPSVQPVIAGSEMPPPPPYCLTDNPSASAEQQCSRQPDLPTLPSQHVSGATVQL